jgi:hypothetical protein
MTKSSLVLSNLKGRTSGASLGDVSRHRSTRTGGACALFYRVGSIRYFSPVAFFSYAATTSGFSASASPIVAV